MPLTDRERAALEQMADTAVDLDRWRLRAHRLEEPERDSELELDDSVYPHMAISQVARMSLVLAGEHLRLAYDAVKAGQIYPSSHFTVLRGALVGASQGVWILSPEDSDERKERGFTVIAEMYKQLDKYYRSLAGPHMSDAQTAELVHQQAWLAHRRAQVSQTSKKGASLNLTEVIADAADVTFTTESHRSAIRLLWREMSADAHVLGWSLFQRSSFGPADRRSGIGEGRAYGSPERIAEPFLASYRLLRRGWSLFDRRCEAPGTP